MSNRSIACCIVGCLATACLAALGCRDGSNPAASAPHGVVAVQQARFITIPDAFGDLKRPPVRFDHDKHTAALNAEGCAPCHDENDADDFLFAYAGVRTRTARTA